MKERFYDALNGVLDRRGFGERRERLVAGLAGDVLEVGAGTGLNLAHYRRPTRVVALEPDRAYARRLRARGRDAGFAVEVVEGRAEALPLPDESFDHVVTTLALCSVDDLDRSLAEIVRVLRPGGALHFLEHVRGNGRVAAWQDRLTPLQRRLADGCHLNRDIAAAIERSELRVDALERFALPGGHALIKPAIQGAAVKDGAAAGELRPARTA
jgi:SAM-dependent methyltransferase